MRFIRPTMSIKIPMAGMLGNAIETYDLLIFGFMTPFLATTFMQESGETDLATLFLIFGTAYFSRPLGAVIFGLIADIFGRKKSLVYSMKILTIASILIASLPTTNMIGSSAIILLTVLRFIQGFSYGNEFVNSITFLYEHAQPWEKCYKSSFAISGSDFGILAASAITLLLTSILDHNQMSTWGWRIAFALSAPGGLLAVYMRNRFPETMDFIKIKFEKSNTPKQSFFGGVAHIKNNLKHYIPLLSIVIFGSYVTYLLFLYLPTISVSSQSLSKNPILIMNCISALILVIFIPFFGKLADKLSMHKIIIFSIIGIILFGTPFLTMASHISSYTLFILQILTAISCAALFCCGSIATIKSFPVGSRGFGSSILYTSPVSIIGGMAPFITLKITSMINTNWSILILFLPLALFALIGAFCLEKGSLR